MVTTMGTLREHVLATLESGIGETLVIGDDEVDVEFSLRISRDATLLK